MVKFAQIRCRLRPFVMAVTAIVLALQLMLSGFAMAHAATPDSSDSFVICYGVGNGPADPPDESNNTPSPRAPCALCILAHASCAIAPPSLVIGHIDVTADAVLGFENDERMPIFESPTSRYQRGPPPAHFAG